MSIIYTYTVRSLSPILPFDVPTVRPSIHYTLYTWSSRYVDRPLATDHLLEKSSDLIYKRSLPPFLSSNTPFVACLRYLSTCKAVCPYFPEDRLKQARSLDPFVRYQRYQNQKHSKNGTCPRFRTTRLRGASCRY